jgi:PTH1 family peptidyl-tRNA hydrolase
LIAAGLSGEVALGKLVSPKFKLIVGLGNPTARYEKTRHNAGFWFMDELALSYRLVLHSETAFYGEVGRLDRQGIVLFMLKPMTYMNRSGQSVAAVARYYKIAPEEILVAHDELDFAPGVVRMKNGGGHGGHNGLRDIIAQLGSPAFFRLRIGVGRPPNRDDVVSYVLDSPRFEENELIRFAIADAVSAFPDLLEGNVDKAMGRLHLSGKP